MTKVQETKKSYEKPEVVYRQAMESVAAVCDPNDAVNPGKGDTSCSVLNS